MIGKTSPMPLLRLLALVAVSLFFVIISNAHALEISGATFDQSTQTITISGSEFDSGLSPPTVTIQLGASLSFVEYPVQAYNTSQIILEANPLFQFLILGTEIVLTVQLEIEEEIIDPFINILLTSKQVRS